MVVYTSALPNVTLNVIVSTVLVSMLVFVTTRGLYALLHASLQATWLV